MQRVFVIDTNQQPLAPVHPGEARRLLTQGKAAVWRRFPFTIILKHAVETPAAPALRIKIDPGSTTTGLAIVNDASGQVVFAAELSHRGQQIKQALDSRRAIRRGRRQRHTRYRAPRFQNRRRRQGWLPPSLESRIANVVTWVERLRRVCPLTAISQELVRFDLQKMQQPEITGKEYQQGTLAGYEVREYLLEKWKRKCAYCGKEDVPFQVEHIVPRAKGGSNRISNLCLACEPCNTKKGAQDLAVFLRKKPDVWQRILTQAKAPLKDAAAVNTTRSALLERLTATGLPVECGSGGRTKWNRSTRGLPKTHWLDAACVGASTPERLQVGGIVPLLIKACGHGGRQMCRMDRYGFPRTGPKRAKKVQGFESGDLVRAVVPAGKKAGVHVGRVAVRSSGSFNITTQRTTVQGISHRHCTLIQRRDGYHSGNGTTHPSPQERSASFLPMPQRQGYPEAEV